MGLSERDGGENTKWQEMRRRVRPRQRGCCLLLRHPKGNLQIGREMDGCRVGALCVRIEEGFLWLTRDVRYALINTRGTSYPNQLGRHSSGQNSLTFQSRQDELALTVSPVRIHPSSSSFVLSSHVCSPSIPQHPPPTFAHLLAHADLPQPGPEHFAARRTLWTTPTAASRLGQAPPISRVRLETLLDEPGALERPDVWEAGLNRVWKGLVDGGRLKSFLPLRAVVCLRFPRFFLYLFLLLDLQVKILYAGWRRDGTWPDNATVVDEDNFFGTIGSEATS